MSSQDLSEKKNVEFKDGDIIIREGQIGHGLFILVSGELEVVRDDVIITRITQKGSFIGEISAILGCRCTATVRASSPCKLVQIEKVTHYLENNPKSAIMIAQTLASRIMDMNQKFIELQKKVFDEWADQTRQENIDPAPAAHKKE